MPSIQAFRDTNTASPFRYLYGTRGGVLLFPLDLTFTHFTPDTADGSGMFIGANVSGPGVAVGTILNYAWPPFGNVTPVVSVMPDPGFPLADAVTLPPLPFPVFAGGTRVVADLGSSMIGGTLLSLVSGANYLNAAHTVDAYITQFDVPLRPDHHGAPVFLADGANSVVGMVTSTQPVFNAPNAFVCPV